MDPVTPGRASATLPGGGQTAAVTGTARSATSASTLRLVETRAAVPVVAILRAPSAEHLVAAAEVVCDAGVRAVEFPLTTPGALDAVRALRARRPDVLV